MPNSKGHFCAGCNRLWYNHVCEHRPDACDGTSVNCPTCSNWRVDPDYEWFYADNDPVDSQVDGGW